MDNFSDKTNIKILKICIIVFLILNVAIIPLYFFDLYPICVGLNIGMGINTLYYLVDYLIAKQRRFNVDKVFIVVSIIVRFILIAAMIVLAALLEFHFMIKAINTIAVAGGYIIPVIINGIVVLTNKEEKNGGTI